MRSGWGFKGEAGRGRAPLPGQAFAGICIRPIVRINLNIKTAVGATVLGLLGLAGCAARLPEPNAADAMRAERLWPGTTVSDLHRGKQRYVQACAGCHGLIDPHQFDSGRWPGFVKEMSGKMQLSSAEVADLTRYLVVASESPRAP
jgi:hypothetical protein